MLGFSPIAASTIADDAGVETTQIVQVFGVYAVAGIGTPIASASISAAVSGLSAVGSAGTATVTATQFATADAVGVQAVGSVGDVSASVGISVKVSAVSATAELAADTVISGNGRVTSAGVVGTSAVGWLTISGSAVAATGGEVTFGIVGDVKAGVLTTTIVGGLAASTDVGTVGATGSAHVTTYGIFIVGRIGVVTVRGGWVPVRPAQNQSYANVDTEQNPSYSAVNPATEQNPSYSAVNPAQEPVWQQIET